ncbi:MAG: crotonase [Pseudonocardiaceae bacterium]|nr:crotonase [Pseudonocardiaceae bacterium]
MNDLDFLETSGDGAIGRVWLDRPPVNAVNQQMYEELRLLFGSLTDHLPAARVVVLCGAGRHFCAGNDVRDFQTMDPGNAPERMRLVREAFWALYDSPVPVIAAVHGAALGTGLALAASCDVVVAADSASFGLPEITVGVMGGAKHLSRLVPQSLVRLLHLTGDPMPAQEFAHYGGVVDVVPDDHLLDKADELAARMTRHSPAALRFAKRSLNAIEYLDLKNGYEFEQGLSSELSGYADAKEAADAFVQRRPPHYTGH